MLMADIVTLIIFFIGIYYLGIALFAFFPAVKTRKSTKQNTFAVIIPAHNEENVIRDLLISIKNANYPRKNISTFVIADGCTDKTADIAKQMGATVIEKENALGKGDALKTAFSSSEFLKHSFDCVAVFDADNIVDSNFFTEMNDLINSGFSVVQGYVDSKNPNASWVSTAHSMWYFITNRIFQTGRSRLNMGAKLNGTGFVVKTDILKKIPWDTVTLSEDAEYTCTLALSQIKVHYAECAVVYDEKPVDFKTSVSQRKRWAQGMRDVQGEYTLKLLFKGYINALLGLWNDTLSVIIPFLMLVLTIFNIGIWGNFVCKITVYLYIVLWFALCLLAIIYDKKADRKIILNLFSLILYIASWLPIGISGLFEKGKISWKHTKHGM